MKNKMGRTVFLVFFALFAFLPALTSPGPARAELEAVGPADPDNGFPLWYQDEEALALGPCLENNRFCDLPLPGEQFGFNPFAPIVFPDNFPVEFAYFAVEAAVPRFIDDPLRRYEVALEGGFAGIFVNNGDQIVSVRLRFRVDLDRVPGLPAAADYAVTHPYGVSIFRNVPATGRILVDTAATDPLPVPLDFNTVLGGIVGPFLESDDPANRDVRDPLTGNIYLTNPLTPVPVAGSPFENVFRVDRLTPGGTADDVVETVASADLFFLFGKKVGTFIASPPKLVFPEQNVAPVSTDLPVTLTNLSPLRTPDLGQITVAGPNAADFTIIEDDCSGRPIDGLDSCTFEVRFSGQANAADRSATVIIPSDGGEFSPLTVPVSGTIDSIPPVVVAVFPVNNGLAPANMMIIAQFDDNLDPLTVNATTFSVRTPDGPVAGLVTYDDGSRIAVFTPNVFLEQGVVHTARIAGAPGGVTDSVGNELQADFTWTFTGAPPDFVPPAVISTNPLNGSRGFPTGSPITVTFDEPMLSFTVNEGTFLLDTAAGPVAGKVEFDLLTNSAVFTPLSPLELGTDHTITVTGAQDLAGNALAPDFTSAFLSNFRPEAPELLSPSNQATGVPRPVTLTWTVPNDPDGDPLLFNVSVCNNASFIGSGPDCQQNILVTASAETVATFQYAGLGMLFGLIGAVLMGSRNRRQVIMLALVAATIAASALFYSCGGGGGGGGVAQPAGIASTQVTGLSSGVTFFWRVEADDGKGGTSVSDVSTFATR